jgi:hypothetical protein
MKSDKWTVYITELVRHEIEVEIDKSAGVYPYEEPRRIAKEQLEKLKKLRPENNFSLEQVTRDKPEAYCYFDSLGRG